MPIADNAFFQSSAQLPISLKLGDVVLSGFKEPATLPEFTYDKKITTKMMSAGLSPTGQIVPGYRIFSIYGGNPNMYDLTITLPVIFPAEVKLLRSYYEGSNTHNGIFSYTDELGNIYSATFQKNGFIPSNYKFFLRVAQKVECKLHIIEQTTVAPGS